MTDKIKPISPIPSEVNVSPESRNRKSKEDFKDILQDEMKKKMKERKSKLDNIKK